MLLKRTIQIRHVRRVVFVVVDLHGHRIDKRLQRVLHGSGRFKAIFLHMGLTFYI
jgi:hypothetical protein